MIRGGQTMADRFVTTSVAGFIQVPAVSCVAHGYYFYVVGEIPPNKDPMLTDAKILIPSSGLPAVLGGAGL
jgi:hypothetical protein